MPEDERIRQAQGLATPGQGFVETLKGPAGRAVHEREGDDSRRQDAAIPGHDEADAHVVEKDADRVLQAEDQEQQPAADRRRQDQGQGQDDIEEPLRTRGRRAT